MVLRVGPVERQYEGDLGGDLPVLARPGAPCPKALHNSWCCPECPAADSCDRTPILMLTARDAVSDRVGGLDAGADDYLTKPFALEELLARVRALLRRDQAGQDGTLAVADLELDPRSRQVTRGERPMELTRTEFALLELLLRNAGTVLTRDTIRERVWGFDDPYGSNTLDVYIGYLRRKTEAGGEPRLIHTVRGVGFILRGP